MCKKTCKNNISCTCISNKKKKMLDRRSGSNAHTTQSMHVCNHHNKIIMYDFVCVYEI